MVELTIIEVPVAEFAGVVPIDEVKVDAGEVVFCVQPKPLIMETAADATISMNL